MKVESVLDNIIVMSYVCKYCSLMNLNYMIILGISRLSEGSSLLRKGPTLEVLTSNHCYEWLGYPCLFDFHY